VNATLIIDPAIFAGADPDGGALLYSPNPVQPGSSISHWDTLAKPNLLMEPAISANLTHRVDVPADLSVAQMTDIGWFSDFDGVADGRDRCLNSDQTGTVVIQSCDSGVADVNSVLRTGCRISDDVKACAASSSTHDKFLTCTVSLTDELKKLRVINGRQRRMIQVCAEQSSLP
jgi:hypothetical protein